MFKKSFRKKKSLFPRKDKIKFSVRRKLRKGKGLLSLFKRPPKISEKSEKTTPSKTWDYFQRGIYWGLIIGFIILVFYLAIYSPIFRVRNPIITGYEIAPYSDLYVTTKNALSGKQYYVFPKDNALFVDTNALSQEIQSQNQAIKEVKVSRHFPSTLRIEVQEKEQHLIWQRNQKYYQIDDKGIMYHQLTLDKIDDLLENPEHIKYTVNDEKSSQNFKIGDRVAEQSFIDFAKSLSSVMEKYTVLKVSKIVTPDPATREIHLYTENEWIIRLDTSRDLIHEIKVLNKVVLEKLSPEELEKIEYIDLRVKDKVYYKLK